CEGGGPVVEEGRGLYQAAQAQGARSDADLVEGSLRGQILVKEIQGDGRQAEIGRQRGRPLLEPGSDLSQKRGEEEDKEEARSSAQIAAAISSHHRPSRRRDGRKLSG